MRDQTRRIAARRGPLGRVGDVVMDRPVADVDGIDLARQAHG